MTGLSRIDGRLKVTGAARYSAEFTPAGMVYGVLVGSTITKGTIRAIDTKAAERAPGVLAVITHLNSPKIAGYQVEPGKPEPAKGTYKLFYNNKILFNGQPIAVVVADTFERAQYAASLVKAQYNADPHHTKLVDNISSTHCDTTGVKTFSKAGGRITKRSVCKYVMPRLSAASN